MDEPSKTNNGPEVIVEVPLKHTEPPPYTEEDEKQFQNNLLNAKQENTNLKNEEIERTCMDNIPAKELKTEEEPNEYTLIFSEKSIRRAFARKVFAILALLLLKTVLYSALCIYCKPIQKFWYNNLLHVLWGMPVYIITALIIIFGTNIRKRTPWNYILLLSFSSSLTFMIGGICAVFQQEVVMIAFAMTTALVLGLTWFAFQTKWDFTCASMLIFSAAFVLSLTTVTSLSYLSIGGRIALAGLSVFIFSICLVFDIQFIIDGDHTYKISPEEHIFAVMVLYLDIVRLFLIILRFMR